MNVHAFDTRYMLDGGEMKWVGLNIRIESSTISLNKASMSAEVIHIRMCVYHIYIYIKIL